MRDDPFHLVLESSAVHARADGNQRAEGPVRSPEPEVHAATTDPGEATRLLYTGRLWNHHLHHAARLSVSRASDAAHI